MPETVVLEKRLDGASIWIEGAPQRVRMEVVWHRESADQSARTVEGTRTFWEVNPDGTNGVLQAAFNAALLPPDPTLADLFRVVRDSYILPSI